MTTMMNDFDTLLVSAQALLTGQLPMNFMTTTPLAILPSSSSATEIGMYHSQQLSAVDIIQEKVLYHS